MDSLVPARGRTGDDADVSVVPRTYRRVHLAETGQLTRPQTSQRQMNRRPKDRQVIHVKPPMMPSAGPAAHVVRHKTLILGGGFAGANVARLMGDDVTIVSPESAMLYTPLLPEVAAG